MLRVFPALPRERIAEWIPKAFLSFHITVNPPLGEYNRNSAVNTGANRWAFTPLFNLNIPLNNGVAWLEFYAWGRFFTNNSEFQGNKLLSQDPLGVVGAYYSHNIGKKMYAAIGGYYDYGGESFVNSVAQHDIANGFRPSVGISRKFGQFRVGLRYENTATKLRARVRYWCSRYPCRLFLSSKRRRLHPASRLTCRANRTDWRRSTFAKPFQTF
jgi:hypothetical protein